VTEQVHSPFQKRRIVKWFFTLIAVLFTPVFLYASHELWQNNRSIDAPSPQLISESHEKGINWLVNNREIILGNNNPMLWWFIKQSADITRDERLHTLFSEYTRRYLDPYPRNVWWHLFDIESKAPVDVRQLDYLPDYNLYFIYGATCNSSLAYEEIIRRQNDPEFCGTYHPFSPACVTHQLMGVRLAQRRRCLSPQIKQELVLALQDKIVKQLVWDPRVVDVYIQRVLMLAESGVAHKIKPVWIQRVLDAQSTDGGWDNFHIVFPVNRTQYMGITDRLVIGEPKSDFHATAQGVYLLSLIVNGSGMAKTTKPFP
jgi:hypothetical protein